MAMTAAALVFLGGGAGAVARYGLVRLGEGLVGASFPLGVFAANLVGSFLIGAVAGWLIARGEAWMILGDDTIRWAVMTGFLGGFTTFSAFSLDAIRLWSDGAPMLAVGYVLGSVVIAIGACLAGLILMRGAA